MKLLIVGVLVNPKAVAKHPGVSGATNKWQFDLIHSLDKNGCEIETLTYISEPTWPKGRMFPRLADEDKEGTFNRYWFTYLNIVGIRELSIYLNMRKYVKRLMAECAYDYVVTFNSLSRNNLIGNFIKQKSTCQWISIVGDGPAPVNADRIIFLSQSSFTNSLFEGKFLFEGGIPPFKEGVKDFPGKRTLVFTGTITKLTGIEKFAELFSQLSLKNVELAIYGRGDFGYLHKLAEKNSNIKVYGYVSESELGESMEKAFAFVNPRHEAAEDNSNTFPSKLLEYISYGKPIISTNTSSLRSELKELLFLYNSNDIYSLEAILNKLLNMSSSELETIKIRAKRFSETFSWTANTKRLVDYLRK